MKRDKLDQLYVWKNDLSRKPLILRGARQTGKTWLLKEFGNQAYNKFVYVNFEQQANLKTLFTSDFDIQRIITTLEILTGFTITAHDTLIVFDEIQAVENGLSALKYFYENAPQYQVIAAGSLLGVTLHKGTSFPVGKVEFLDLYPLSFTEFLEAMNEERLASLIKNKNWEVSIIFHDKLIELLRYYFFVGGMPEVVKSFAEKRDWQAVRKIQNQLLDSYQSDFSKYAPLEIVPRIHLVWNSIPAQLAKENKKFMFNVLREGARAKDFEIAIQWLLDCGLLLKTNRVKTAKLPLVAYEEFSVYKLFLLDIGLLAAMTQIKSDILIEGNHVFTEFKGAMAEQFVRQQLQNKADLYIGYWTNDKSTAEIDFVVQKDNEVIPIEVKSGTNVRSKSFKLFYDQFLPKTAYKTSLQPFEKQEWFTNLPLYGIAHF